jgi:uncharacterized coiled-coil protein SlyX
MRTGTRAVSPILAAAILAACALSASDPPAPARDTTAARVVVETVTVRDPELEQRVAGLELRLLEREAQVEELQAKLDDARHEVVRAMARFQTLASRAEAASGMAESEIALRSLRAGAGAEGAPEIAQARELLQLAAAEFNKQNYGGALYLASQAKSVVGAARERLASDARGSLRPGEVLFTLPLRLQTTSRSNVREGPGASFPVLFTAEAGTRLTGYSLADRWVRVSDETGRSGWILQSLLGRRQEDGR